MRDGKKLYIEESFDLDRTSLTLRFVKKQVIKTDKHMEKIRLYLQEQEIAKTKDFAGLCGLSVARARVVLSDMNDVEALGINRSSAYRLKM